MDNDSRFSEIDQKLRPDSLEIKVLIYLNEKKRLSGKDISKHFKIGLDRTYEVVDFLIRHDLVKIVI